MALTSKASSPKVAVPLGKAAARAAREGAVLCSHCSPPHHHGSSGYALHHGVKSIAVAGSPASRAPSSAENGGTARRLASRSPRYGRGTSSTKLLSQKHRLK